MEKSDTEQIRERVGLLIAGSDTQASVVSIREAEEAGVRQVWMTQGTPAPDALTVFAAGIRETSRIRLGTAIIPLYQRHPLTLAQEVVTLDDLAPGRLRLGVGTSHRSSVEGMYGIPMKSPLEHLHEYVEILRAALWEGKVDHQGRFYTVKVTFPRVARIPLLISALSTGAFELAGAVSDGAISWMCPVPYLLDKALLALRSGAAKAGRSVSPLVAHIPVALSADRQAVLAAARKQLGGYGKLPFYARMFADAGFAVLADGTMPDALIDSLVVSGDEASVAGHLRDLISKGLNELLVMSVSVSNTEREQAQLMRLIGQL
jgi:alkanesulfonate monooxygenase SsuD/methylene tetrahydromethanopterin reductase-like flavin-dependent oxidoreductase (luciferase family)